MHNYHPNGLSWAKFAKNMTPFNHPVPHELQTSASRNSQQPSHVSALTGHRNAAIGNILTEDGHDPFRLRLI